MKCWEKLSYFDCALAKSRLHRLFSEAIDLYRFDRARSEPLIQICYLYVIHLALCIRREMTKGHFFRGSHETNARKLIDPIIDSIRKLDSAGDNAINRKISLKDLLSMLDKKNPLYKELEGSELLELLNEPSHIYSELIYPHHFLPWL